MYTELLIVAVCLSLNALLACIEMAFVSVGRPQLRQLSRKANGDARRLLRLRDNPERSLSIIQIGITLVGAVSAAVGGAGAEETLSPWLRDTFGWSDGTAEAIAILSVVVPITFLSVVVGELVPKTIALRNPLPIALFGARWLVLADRLLAPVITIMEWSTKVIMMPFVRRLPPVQPATESTATAEEIESLSDEHREYVANLVNLEKKRIRDIMVPWKEVATLEVGTPTAEVAAIFMTSAHSRLPVLEGGCVKGFLYAREFMGLAASGGEEWHSILRPMLKVRDTDQLLRVMRLMQEKRNHLSLVESRSGEIIGIVSLEDIIEEVVGEIYDEDDDGNLRRVLSESGKTRTLLFGGRNKTGLFRSTVVAPDPLK